MISELVVGMCKLNSDRELIRIIHLCKWSLCNCLQHKADKLNYM